MPRKSKSHQPSLFDEETPRVRPCPARRGELADLMEATLPGPIAGLAYTNKAVLCDILFKASAEATLTIAADPKRLGARIGITSVLHTWGSAMTHHPHVHMIVPGGGLSKDRTKWIACRPNFLLPVRVLSRLFRRLVLAMLLEAYGEGRLRFFAEHAALAERQAFAAFLRPLKRSEWVVYAKRPFAGPEAVLAYLSRYTHRVAISNSRLIAADASTVTFKVKDYRLDGAARFKTMTLATGEFIRRFLMHVLPKSFHRIRHYGLLANGGPDLAHAALGSAAGVNSENCAGNVAAALPQQELHPFRNVARFSQPAQCAPVGDAAHIFLAHSLSHGGLDEAGRHRIDCDAKAAHFARQRLGKSDHRGLRGRVGGHTAIAREANNGADIHDASGARCHHGSHDEFCQNDWRHRIELNEFLDLGNRHVGQNAIGSQRGIVNEPIDRPELFANLRNQTGDCGDVAEIGRHERQCAGLFSRHLFDCLGKLIVLFARDSDNAVTGAGQRSRNCEAKAAASTRYNHVKHCCAPASRLHSWATTAQSE